MQWCLYFWVLINNYFAVCMCAVCEHASLHVCGSAFPAEFALTKHFFFYSELTVQLLDTVRPHTYSNSLIHKSHRLTLGSPRCPDRWEQKPREESRQEEEEEEEVSESWGREKEECCIVLAWPTDTWRRALLIKPEPTLFIVSHGLSITQTQSH